MKLLGVAPSTWHYRNSPRPRSAAPIPHKDRRYPNELSASERTAIERHLTEGRSEGLTVAQIFHRSWDQGTMLASLSTWHRIDAGMRAPESDAGRRRRAPRTVPMVVATKPGQVWSWDISELPSVYSRVSFKLYSVIDVFSRARIAERVESREDGQVAADMFKEAFGTEGIPDVVHSDNGSTMRSDAVLDLLKDVGVEVSNSRPYVSNDNPYSESSFGTMKTQPGYPTAFASVEEARNYVRVDAKRYNEVKYHSGIAHFTPAQVHDGSWKNTWQDREDVLQSYYRAHPERYRAKPRTPQPAETVGINLPTKNR